MSTRGEVGVLVSPKAIAFAEILNALAVFAELFPEVDEVVCALLVLDPELELGNLMESSEDGVFAVVGDTTAAA